MKNGIYILLILFIISCSKEDNINNELILNNKLEITYRGYYEEYFELPYQQEVYADIEIKNIREQTSSIEELNLLQIIAKSRDTDKYISFKVLENSVGDDVLYNDKFRFISSGGASYSPSKLYFQVLTNNDKEFVANFSGELKHWYEGEQKYVYLDIKNGSIVITTY